VEKANHRAALTVSPGLVTIKYASVMVLVASAGQGRSGACYGRGRGTRTMWPATILQFRPRISALIDGAAASMLQLADYFARPTPSGRDRALPLTRVG
jgi:glucosamine-6-phosphate deaminase